MNIETAKKIIETLECVNRSIFGLIPYLEERCSDEELDKLKREIARVSNGIDMNLYPIILKQYPELNPLSVKE
ncbi:hypothetical protein ACSV5M_00020 [Cellvibrio sp. ARAG 10.3]|uniref:hypothetical protein n=1 Tax=Cellvibrio sp. ARAG 10.3 TaxID=3451358 RepID=UPI003F463B00